MACAVGKAALAVNVGVLTQAVAEILCSIMNPVAAGGADQAGQTWLFERLVGTVDVHAYPSAANFILFRLPHAAKVFEGLKQRGVLIKSWMAGIPHCWIACA